MWFDSHMHLEPEDDVTVILEHALAVGVTRLLAVGGGAVMNADSVAAAAAHPEHVYASVGYDRHHVEIPENATAPEVFMHRLRELLDVAGEQVVALGETGLDYHYSPESAAAQRALFEAHLELSRATRRPVIIHTREAEDDTLRLLRHHREQWSGDPDRVGVLHCFTGHADLARELVALDYYVSFSGIATFRNAAMIRDAAAIVPEHRLLVETDSPYLAPVPHRGQRNEPALLPYVGNVIAEVRGVSPVDIATTTAANACRLFGVGDGSR